MSRINVLEDGQLIFISYPTGSFDFFRSSPLYDMSKHDLLIIQKAVAKELKKVEKAESK